MSLKTRSQYQDGNTSSCVELVEKVNNGVTVVLASKLGFGLGRINVINLGYSTIGSRSRNKLGAAVAANKWMEENLLPAYPLGDIKCTTLPK